MVNKSDKNNQVTPTLKGRTDAKNWLITIGRNWSLIFLAGELILFSLIGTNFFTLRNFQNILIAAITILLLATGETFVIITGGIDLSVGFVMGLSCVVCAKIMVALQAAGAPQAVCILTGIIVALLIGLIPGLVNGFLVAKLKVPSFIATFGIYGIAYGFAEIICRSVPVSRLPSAVGFIGHGYLAYLIPGKILTFFRQPENLSRLESRSLMGIVPNVFIIALVFIIIFGFILTKTKFGQHTYAIGGNIDSAERAGINVGRHLLKIYMISSFFASMGGVIYVLKFVTGRADAGAVRMLDAIAAVVIGGASLYGGTGRVWGSMIGAMIIGVLETGMVNIGMPTFNKYIYVGCILIIAVLIDQFFPELMYREEK